MNSVVIAHNGGSHMGTVYNVLVVYSHILCLMHMYSTIGNNIPMRMLVVT
jgi:hypothetical protein